LSDVGEYINDYLAQKPNDSGFFLCLGGHTLTAADGRRFWDFGALKADNPRSYRTVKAGDLVPYRSMAIAAINTGYTYTARKQDDGTVRVYKQTAQRGAA